MPAQTGIRITGLNEKVRDLERLGVASGDLKDAFGEISRDVADDAQDRIRVLTGAHRDSIRPGRNKNKAVIRAGNNTNAPAAGVLNYGGHGVKGDGFLTTPANTNLDEKAQRIQDNLDALIAKYDLDSKGIR